MAAPKNNVDWERIEADYRAGVKSLREIAEGSGVSHVTISKRAKASGWEKDLGPKIKARAEALLNKAELTEPVNTLTPVKEQETIESNAVAIVTVKLGHRKDIKRLKQLLLSLLSEVEVETGSIEVFEELGEILRSEDERGNDRRNDVYRKVLSSASRVDSMKKLAETLKILIGMEREAFGIAEAQRLELTGAGGGPIQTYELTDTERALRIATLLDAARARRDGQAPAVAEDVGAVSGAADPSV